MSNDSIEMGKTHDEWAQNYQTISKMMERQVAELKTLFHKTLMMRYETTVLGLQYLKCVNQLHVTRQALETIEAEQSEDPDLQ